MFNNVNFHSESGTFNNAGRDMNIVQYHISTVTGEQDVRQLLSQSGLPSRQLPSSALPFNEAPIHHISPCFTGREEELETIKTLLSCRSDDDVPACCAIYGMPGIGKTQVGIEYAKRSYNRQQYQIIFWISAANIERLHQGYTNILYLVDHRDRHHAEQSARLMSARRWLETTDLKWLLIVDNIYQESIHFLRDHMPRRNSRGNILFTTRTSVIATDVVSAMRQHSHALEIHPLSVTDAVTLLQKEAHIFDAGKVAEDVVKSVGCLPLAVSQAASFVKASRKNLQDVLELYRGDHKYEMISWENSLSRYEEKSIVALFSSTLENLGHQFPNICSLLQILSFFDPEAIPVKMIVDGARRLSPQQISPPPLPMADTSLPEAVTGGTHVSAPDSFLRVDALKKLILSPILLPQAIQQLQQLSLLDTNSESSPDSALQIHDLTRTIVQEYAWKKPTYRQWFEAASALVCNAFQQIDDLDSPMNWADCEVFNPHLQSLITLGDKHTFGNLVPNEALSDMARYLYGRGRYDEAESLLQRALTVCENSLGLDHVDTLRVVKRLGMVYYYKGLYDEAGLLCQRALAGREKALGPEHPRTLLAINNLAIIHQMQGKYDEAESLYKRALEGQEKVLGTEYPDTLTTVDNLAIVIELKGQYGEAESLYKRALAGREKVLGPEHPDTLYTANGLAGIYQLKGKYDEAESLYRRALGVREQVLGPEHPDTLWTVECLANLSRDRGQHEDAGLLYTRALEGNEKLLGSEHPGTLNTVHNFALLCRNRGSQGEAEALFNRALKGRQKKLAPKHPETLRTVEAFASFLDTQGRSEEAKVLRDQHAAS